MKAAGASGEDRGSRQPTVLAIDAGGTYFKSALVAAGGGIIAGSFLQTPASFSGSKAEVIGAYEKVFDASFAFARAHALQITGVGISTPGPFDYAGGISLMDHKFRSIKNLPLREEFARLAYFTEKTPVIFQQDVHAFLVGEHWAGAVRGVANVAAITIGTGLGFGVMRNSVIVDNGRGGPCVAVFNRPFGQGILEDRISRRGFIAQYGKYAGIPESGLDVYAISQRARVQNDPLARKVFYEAGRIMAEELAGVFKEFAIENLVFGGQISKSFDLFGPAFAARLRELGMAIKAVPGANIDFSALLGAAQNVFAKVA